MGTPPQRVADTKPNAPSRVFPEHSMRCVPSGLDADTGGGSLAEMIIELGRALGLTVIAEGVETPTQRQRLIELGCNELQGYLFSPPLAVESLGEWLARHGEGFAL